MRYKLKGAGRWNETECGKNMISEFGPSLLSRTGQSEKIWSRRRKTMLEPIVKTKCDKIGQRVGNHQTQLAENQKPKLEFKFENKNESKNENGRKRKIDPEKYKGERKLMKSWIGTKLAEKIDTDVRVGTPPILKLNLTKTNFKSKNSPKMNKNGEKTFLPVRKPKNGAKKMGSNVRKISHFFENIQKQAELESKTLVKASQPSKTSKLANSMLRGGGNLREQLGEGQRVGWKVPVQIFLN